MTHLLVLRICLTLARRSECIEPVSNLGGTQTHELSDGSMYLCCLDLNFEIIIMHYITTLHFLNQLLGRNTSMESNH